MCGRYSLQTKRVDLARELTLREDEVLDLPPRWNVAPSQPVPVLRRREGAGASRPVMALHVWGLVPAFAKSPGTPGRLINARRESLGTRASFRDSYLQGRRCLVIADGFYEWAPIKPGGPRMPHYIRLKSGGPFTFAGLWARWRPREGEGEPLDTCTIVTGPPNEVVRALHDRMPVILPAESREPWLDPELRDEKKLAALLETFPADRLESYPVSRHVNSPDHDDPSCIERFLEGATAPVGGPRRRSRAPRGGSSGNLDLFTDS